MGFYLLDCPFKPTLLLSHALSDSLSLYVPFDSTPFYPGHLFITSVVGGEKVGRCQPETFRSMSMGGWGTLSPYRKIVTKGINDNYYNFGTGGIRVCGRIRTYNLQHGSVFLEKKMTAKITQPPVILFKFMDKHEQCTLYKQTSSSHI